MTEAAGLVGLFLTALSGATPAPDPDAIKAAAARILAQGPYDLGERYKYFDVSWVFRKILDFIGHVTSALGVMSPGVVEAVVVILVVILVALLAHIVYSFFTVLRAAQTPDFDISATPTPTPAVLESEAIRLAAERNFTDASRTLYRAALIMLENRREGRLMSALTNSEYLRTFHAPWVIENLKVFADLITWKWYRSCAFDEDDYRLCYTAYRALETRLSQEAA